MRKLFILGTLGMVPLWLSVMAKAAGDDTRSPGEGNPAPGKEDNTGGVTTGGGRTSGGEGDIGTGSSAATGTGGSNAVGADIEGNSAGTGSGTGTGGGGSTATGRGNSKIP
ncbi:MAG TPA: hypothetical protein VH186_34205 [Chloroflexia bacterium]|nr:hypothetical protein [Chloroflexia bacterium]